MLASPTVESVCHHSEADGTLGHCFGFFSPQWLRSHQPGTELGLDVVLGLLVGEVLNDEGSQHQGPGRWDACTLQEEYFPGSYKAPNRNC